MTLIDFLKASRQRGIVLSIENGGLKVQAPKGAVTAELRAAMSAHRQALLDLLAAAEPASAMPLPQIVPDRENLHAPFPMSDLQLGFYMADDPYMDFHVRPHYYVEKDGGTLDVAAYQAAWNRVLLRHRHDIPVVRPNGELQLVREAPVLDIARYDLRDLPAPEASEALEATRAAMMRSELPLDRWPWLDIRVSLWHDEHGAARSRVHCNFNNFFVDGLGTTRLLQEVTQLYHDPRRHPEPLALSFRDAVLALDRLAASAAGQTAKRYWEERLPQLPGPPDIPVKSGLDRRCRARLNRRKHAIAEPAWSQFKAHARQAGLTPSNAMFAVYAELIAVWSNSRHFVLSNMMTRRLGPHPEMREIAGNFASLYPLEIDLREGASFAGRARRIQEQVIRDTQHLQWGGMQVLQALNRLKGSFGRAPLPFVVGSGLFIEGFELDGFSCLETSQVMLDFQFFESADGRLCYVWDLLEAFFPDGMIDDMWQAMAGLVEALAHDAALWQCPLFHLIPARQLVQRKPPVPQAIPEIRLDEWLQHTAQACPDALALVTPDTAMPYAALALAARRLAVTLRESGVRQGDVVGVMAERGPQLLAAVYGILLADAAYLPLDPALPQARRTLLLQDCGVRHVLTDRALDAMHPGAVAFPPGVRVLAADAAEGGAGAPDLACLPLHHGNSGDLAYVIYTSGSTGQPKGVMIDHRAALNTILAVNRRFGVGPDDRLFGVSSFGFDLSVYDIFGAAAAGATLVYPDPRRALDPAHWLDMLAGHQVTLWNSAPPLAALLVELAEHRGAVLPDLRLVLLSGDWIALDLPDRIRRIAPNAELVSLGGATEAAIWSIWYPIGAVDRAWPSIPYGFAMPNQSVQVLDDWGRPAPEWTAGEIHIGGAGLALGYRNDPGKTAASFIRHSLTGERLYRTGDIGRYLPGGVIEFMGRRDTQVKIQGHRIELGEIETVLAQYPGVSAAVVIAQKPLAGTGAQLVAHVVLTAEAGAPPANQPQATALQEFLASRLPAYMVPRLFNFLPLLPLNSNGKIDRKALPRLDLFPVEPSPARRAEPADEIEARLLAIWRQVLGIEELAVTDDFFELGGQSFEAVRVAGLIRETMKLTFSIGDLWECRSIARLAARLRPGAGRIASPCLVKLDGGNGRNGGNGAPLFLVHPAGGHVLCYTRLAAGLQGRVYGFQAPGTDGRTTPLHSIPAFAARYRRLLQDVQPTGPVLLGGWSSGALIAHEMAAQLRAHGREVAGVILIDCPAPHIHDTVSDDELFSWFAGDLDLEPAVCTALRKIDGADMALRIERAAACLRDHGIALGADAAQLAAIYRVFCGIVRAGRQYRADVIDVDLLVIRARQCNVSEFAGHPYQDCLDWGWHLLSSKVVRSAEVSGTHHSLLGAAAVSAVIAIIENWLTRHSGSSDTRQMIKMSYARTSD